MAKKRQRGPREAAPGAAAAITAAPPSGDARAAAVLALVLFVAPAVGVPGELVLQDTLKSIVVSFGALAAALLFVLGRRGESGAPQWHGIVWLPLLLMAYALGSMTWSHAYLGGVEAVRWFVFALLAWLALNTLSRERLPWLAWAAHGGAVVATLWAMAQFWGGLALFPQGPQPASTFINRNFFAEFVACTLPFSLLLLARGRRPLAIAAVALSTGLVVTGILMTGTRAALMAMWFELLVVLPLVAWRCRGELAWSGWPARMRLLAAGVLAATVLGLGVIPTSNPKIVEEGHGTTALERGFQRTRSIGPQDYSLGVRMVMWRATEHAIRAKPLVGLGAGAWESEIPLYQADGAQLETDYYVHNEFLQLVAEYGLVGWIFLLLLAAWLLDVAWRSWRAGSPEAEAERPWRATLLASLFALMVVSNIGFPWRLAATGALFALCLGALAASDVRLGAAARAFARPLRWSPPIRTGAIAAIAACTALALFISERAVESESKLVGAARIALAISASGDWNNPKWDPLKREMLQLTREGVAINPHYRKITPMVADELARWGDWANAIWIWESVLKSRPNIVVINTNVARGYARLGRNDIALTYLQRARSIQPRAPSVHSFEVILTARSGDEKRALQLARQALDAGISDYDLLNTGSLLAWRAHEYALARRWLAERVERWPENRARGLMQLGLLAMQQDDRAQAVAYFRQALAEATPAERPAFSNDVPPALRAELGLEVPQTSASSR